MNGFTNSPKRQPKNLMRAQKSIPLLTKLIGQVGEKFAEHTEYLARYGYAMERGYGGLDLPQIAYFCMKALKANEVSHMLLEKLSEELKAGAGSKAELKLLARRPKASQALPLPIGLDVELEKALHLRMRRRTKR